MTVFINFLSNHDLSLVVLNNMEYYKYTLYIRYFSISILLNTSINRIQFIFSTYTLHLISYSCNLSSLNLTQIGIKAFYF